MSDPSDADPMPPTEAPAPPAPAAPDSPAESEPFDFADNGASARAERAALRGMRPAASPEPMPAEPPRRGFFRKLLATAVGGIVVAVPAAAGLMVFFDPVRRARRAAGASAAGGSGEFVPVAPLDAVPADGRPVKFQVIADRSDAWNTYRNVPLGAVYVKRAGAAAGAGTGAGVVAWNVVCPHAGCFVDVAPDGKSFRCPCHNSGFHADGSLAPGSVSPRAMDELEVDAEALKQGTVRVKFQNFVAGTHEKIPIT